MRLKNSLETYSTEESSVYIELQAWEPVLISEFEIRTLKSFDDTHCVL